MDLGVDYFEEQKARFDLVATQDLYSLPSDCVKVNQLRLAYTTPSDEGDYVIAREYDPELIGSVSDEEGGVS